MTPEQKQRWVELAQVFVFFTILAAVWVVFTGCEIPTLWEKNVYREARCEVLVWEDQDGDGGLFSVTDQDGVYSEIMADSVLFYDCTVKSANGVIVWNGQGWTSR